MSLNNFIVWEDVFTPGELDGIVALGDRLVAERATITEEAKAHPETRITRIAWMPPGPAHQMLFSRLGAVARRINEEFFGFEITSLEAMQYTVYEGAEGGHYGWHVDWGPRAARKLSFSLQLSDPAAYEGCELQFQFGPKEAVAPKTRGALIAFPSFFLHRVTPATSGIRKSLVIWATGPAFR